MEQYFAFNIFLSFFCYYLFAITHLSPLRMFLQGIKTLRKISGAIFYIVIEGFHLLYLKIIFSKAFEIIPSLTKKKIYFTKDNYFSGNSS